MPSMKCIGWSAIFLAGGCATTSTPPLPAGFERHTAPGVWERPSRKPLPTTPVSLEEAVALAFERNPDLRAAAERIAIADAHVEEATAAFYPQIGARLSYGRTDNAGQAFGMIVSQRRFSSTIDINNPGAIQNWRPELVATLSLFRGFRDFNGVEAARKAVEITALERSSLRNALAKAVAETYFVHLATTQQVEVTYASVKAVESELAQARQRFDAGALVKADVLSLEVRLASARDDQVRARNGVEQARTSLRVLLGLAPEESVELSTDLPPEDATLPRTREDALALAAASRPELEAAARLIGLRQTELSAEQGARYPSVDAFASYGQDAPDLGFSSKQDNWAFGFSVDLPLFNGFRTRARISSAEHRIEEARSLEVQVRLAIEQEVRTSILHREEARERVSVTEKAVSAAEEALRLVREQYQAGTATLTRYLEAEAALTDARSRRIAGRTDLRRSEAELRKAVGAWK
jgi:TolC family type I secretion outer membrane protein